MTDVPCALDRPIESFNDYEKKLVANVREHGWQGTNVFADPDEGKPGFCYSIGFWRMASIPEILITGLPVDVGHGVLRCIHEMAAEGFVPPVGVPVSGLLTGHDCLFFPITPQAYREYPLSANWFYGNKDYPCLQLVWPDLAGVFPWQSGFADRFIGDQPDLSPDGWQAHLAN